MRPEDKRQERAALGLPLNHPCSAREPGGLRAAPIPGTLVLQPGTNRQARVLLSGSRSDDAERGWAILAYPKNGPVDGFISVHTYDRRKGSGPLADIGPAHRVFAWGSGVTAPVNIPVSGGATIEVKQRRQQATIGALLYLAQTWDVD